MKRTTLALTFILVVILFIGAIAGTISYYTIVVNSINSKIASLNTQIANLINLNNEIKNLNSQISSLKGQITNLTTANLVTAIEVAEEPINDRPFTFDHLYIAGSVANTGGGTAYNAGLHVVAYGDGLVLVNMTVPLVGGTYGTDSATDIFGNGSTQLGSLGSGQNVTISILIFHEGTVNNWTVTPVWTNSS